MFVTLFNLQGAHRFAAAGVHFTTPFQLCQELFSSFLRLFSALSQPGGPLPYFAPPSQATHIGYHILFPLSRTFFELFKLILFSHPRYFVVAIAVSRTALIEYHSLPLLSTPFLEFFQVFSERGKSRSGRGISALFFSILSSPI